MSLMPTKEDKAYSEGYSDGSRWAGEYISAGKKLLKDYTELSESHRILAEENWKLICQVDSLQSELLKRMREALDKEEKLLKQIDTLREELRFARDEHGC